MRGPAHPGEDPEDVIHPSAIGPLMVRTAARRSEPALEVKLSDWNGGPNVAALI